MEHALLQLPIRWVVRTERGEAIGFGVEFHDFVLDGVKDDSVMKIGLIDTLDTSIIGAGSSYIGGWVRLRVYANR